MLPLPGEILFYGAHLSYWEDTVLNGFVVANIKNLTDIRTFKNWPFLTGKTFVRKFNETSVMIFGPSLVVQSTGQDLGTCVICTLYEDYCQYISLLDFRSNGFQAWGLEIAYPQVYVLYSLDDDDAIFAVYDIVANKLTFNVSGHQYNCELDGPMMTKTDDNKIFVSGLKSVNSTCGTEPATMPAYLLIWNGTCLVGNRRSNFYDWCVSGVVKGPDNLYYGITDLTQVYASPTGTNWTELYDSYYDIFPPVRQLNGLLYFTYQDSDLYYIVWWNGTELNFIEESECASPLSYEIIEGDLWFLCVNQFTFNLQMYNQSSQKVSKNNSLGPVYSTLIDQYSQGMCAYDGNVFALGYFGFEGTLYYAALYNTTTQRWSPVIMQGFVDFAAACTVHGNTLFVTYSPNTGFAPYYYSFEVAVLTIQFRSGEQDLFYSSCFYSDQLINTYAVVATENYIYVGTGDSTLSFVAFSRSTGDASCTVLSTYSYYYISSMTNVGGKIYYAGYFSGSSYGYSLGYYNEVNKTFIPLDWDIWYANSIVGAPASDFPVLLYGGGQNSASKDAGFFSYCGYSTICEPTAYADYLVYSIVQEIDQSYIYILTRLGSIYGYNSIQSVTLLLTSLYNQTMDEDQQIVMMTINYPANNGTIDTSSSTTSSGTASTQASSGTASTQDSSGTASTQDSSGTASTQDSSGTASTQDSSGTASTQASTTRSATSTIGISSASTTGSTVGLSGDPGTIISDDKEGSNSAGVVVGAIVASVTVFLMIIIVILRTRSRKRSDLYHVSSSHTTTNKPARKPHIEIQMVTMDLSEFEIFKVDIGALIGSGNSGEVFQGTYNKSAVALKKLRSVHHDEFVKELNAVKTLRHPNIVSFLGIYRRHSEIYIVTQFLSLGSAVNVVSSKRTLRLQDLIAIATDVVAGLTYLHAQEVVHANLALRNVLLVARTDNEAQYCAKLSDYGLSKTLYGSDYYTSKKNNVGITVPVRWSPPEVIDYGKFSVNSDIWSLGVLLWELFSAGKLPYGEVVSNPDVVDHVMSGGRLAQPKEMNDPVYRLLLQCWKMEPYMRPSLAKISEELDRWWKQIKSAGE